MFRIRAGGTRWIGKPTLDLSPILLASRMSGRASSIQIDSVHCHAISEEIGYRLGLVLRRENPELPPRLKMLLDQLRLEDMESAPSMVPLLDDMVPLETNIPADCCTAPPAAQVPAVPRTDLLAN